jgi:hypothetical protein
MQQYILKFETTEVTPEKVYEEMGYVNVAPDEYVTATVEKTLASVSQFTVPLCAFGLFDGALDGNAVRLDNGGTLDVGPVIASLLRGAEQFALFAATSGDEFQSYFEDLKARADLIEVYIANAVGTCIVEGAGYAMETLLETAIGGRRHTNRFSPGYCNWLLSGQRELFALMGGAPCNISLSDVCLMTPIKSISGIIGIGDSVEEKKYACEYCELETCYKRSRIAGR